MRSLSYGDDTEVTHITWAGMPPIKTYSLGLLRLRVTLFLTEQVCPAATPGLVAITESRGEE